MIRCFQCIELEKMLFTVWLVFVEVFTGGDIIDHLRAVVKYVLIGVIIVRTAVVRVFFGQ